MSRDERDRHFSAGQTHREIFHSAALREEFGLPGKLETRLVHSRFVNWPGDNRLNFATSNQGNSFFKCSGSGARGFNGRRARFALGLPADENILNRLRNTLGFQRAIDNLRPNAGAIAQSYADSQLPTWTHALIEC